MSRSDHFWRQAKRCLRLASGCTDRTMAARLQELAQEYEARASAVARTEPHIEGDERESGAFAGAGEKPAP